jgi:hypothetical protein
MKKLIIFSLIAFSTPSVFGQIKDPKTADMTATTSAKATPVVTTAENPNDVVANAPSFQRFDNLIVPDERYEGIKGNRYFYDNQYHEGTLTMTKNREFGKTMLFRYDQLEGTVQMKYPDGREILVDQNEVLNFNLFVEDKSVIFVRMKTPRTTTFSLVQVIYYSPTMQMVRDPRKKLKRVENTGAYSKNEIYDTYDNDYHYFLKRGKEDLVEVKPSAKSLSKAMPDKAAKIESLFKAAKLKGDLSVSKLADIIKKLDESMKAATENK